MGRELLTGMFVGLLLMSMFFPYQTGVSLGNIHKKFMTGWEQAHQ